MAIRGSPLTLIVLGVLLFSLVTIAGTLSSVALTRPDMAPNNTFPAWMLVFLITRVGIHSRYKLTLAFTCPLEQSTASCHSPNRDGSECKMLCHWRAARSAWSQPIKWGMTCGTVFTRAMLGVPCSLWTHCFATREVQDCCLWSTSILRLALQWQGRVAWR